jgi:amidase
VARGRRARPALELFALAQSVLGRPPERHELEVTAWQMLEEGRDATGGLLRI